MFSGNGAVQILLVPLEERVRLDLQEDEQIAVRTAVRARLAFIGEPQPRAVVHARREC